jgi:geranylgeranylglycerol-phosphate geranylgeranyltransferase
MKTTEKIISKIVAIAGLLKIELPIAAGLCVVVGEMLALGKLQTPFETLLGFLVGFFISGAIMMSNDYFDLKVDRINHPNRPLPSGRITTIELAALTGVFSIVGFLSSYLLGSLSLSIAVVLWVIGFAYNWKFKEAGLVGNLMVSLSVAMTFIFGGLSVNSRFLGLVWVFAACAFVFDLGEEIAGGAMDIEGDRQRSAKSLAITKGRGYALRVSSLLYMLLIVLSLIPLAFGWLGFVYVVLILPTDFAVVYLTFGLLRSKTPKEGRARTRQLYLALVIFVIAFIVSRLI